MRLLITGGGTGGHVYPALSALEAFDPAPELLWIGKTGGMEEPLVKRAGIPYRSIAAGGLADLSWVTRLQHSVKLVRGLGEAWQVLKEFRPDVVFATGGYVTFPVGLAAWLQRIPVAVYLPDITPGLAVRALAPIATKVAVTTPESAKWFGSKAVVTGYPVRQALAHPKSREAARRTFNLPDDARVLLVTGGSLGSHTLNEAIGSFVRDFVSFAHVLHIHGRNDGEWLQLQRAALPEPLQSRYQLFDYLHETMTDALLASDLVVARAGASILGEFPTANLPAILVPLPIAGVNQEANARWLKSQGGAEILSDEQARAALLPLAREILCDVDRLSGMRTALRATARPDAAAAIVDLLRGLAKSSASPVYNEANKAHE